MYLLLLSFLLSISAFAEVGKILKVEGVYDATVLRAGQKISPVTNVDLEESDEIETNNSIVVLHLYPSTQIRLNKNSRIQITQALIQESQVGDDNTSVIKLIKGIIRLQINKDVNQNINQQVNVGDVTFGVRGTDFEINSMTEEVDLDVFEGEVIVTSPHVQTFVPEVVKAKEGFRYGVKKREFIRRKFQPKFISDPGFMPKESLHSRWKKIKENRKIKKSFREKVRSDKRRGRKNR